MDDKKIGYPKVGFPGPYEVYVPNDTADPSLRRGFGPSPEIKARIKQLHDEFKSSLEGHPLYQKITDIIRSEFDWPEVGVGTIHFYIHGPNNYVEVNPHGKCLLEAYEDQKNKGE